jgi:hypothetical protein
LCRRTADRVRRKKEFHALHVGGGRPVTLVHVAATDPLGARRHPDLVSRAVVADGSTDGVAAVAMVIARHRRVSAANPAAGVNAVVPVEVVGGNRSIPATVMGLERGMRPANAGISPGNDDSLARETELPNQRGLRVRNARFDRLGIINLNGGERLLKILDLRIALDARHVGPGSQGFGDLAAAFHP